MASPFKLRKAGGGSALRGIASDTLRGAGGAGVVTNSHVPLVVAYYPAIAGPPGSVESL